MNFHDIAAFDVERAVALLPPGPASLLLLAISVGLALLVHHSAFQLLSRVAAETDLFWRSLVSRSRRPMRLAILIVALGAAGAVAPLTSGQADALGHVLSISLAAWRPLPNA
jgi:hypothetical protein